MEVTTDRNVHPAYRSLLAKRADVLPLVRVKRPVFAYCVDGGAALACGLASTARRITLSGFARRVKATIAVCYAQPAESRVRAGMRTGALVDAELTDHARRLFRVRARRNSIKVR